MTRRALLSIFVALLIGMSAGWPPVTSLHRTAALIEPAAAAVPEPSTWAMMIVGIGAVGAALRRRRKMEAQLSCG